MAITVNGTTTATIASGGGSVSVPGGTAQDDVLVTLIASNNAVTDISTHTLVKNGTVNIGLKLFAKRMSSSPDASITIADNGGDQEVCVWVLRGVDTSAFEDAAATSTGSTKDPPSITPVTDNAWVGAFYGGGAGTIGSVSAPSGYGNALSKDNGVNIQGAGAWKQVSPAAAEDPGAFTASALFNDTITWAVRPAAVAASGNSKNMLLMGVG